VSEVDQRLAPATSPSVEQTAVMLATAYVMLWNTGHAMAMLPVAMVFIVACSPPFTLRQRSWFWLAGAAVWVPAVIIAWDRMEDHVYLGVYWMIALAIGLRDPEFWPSTRFMARVLVGLTFAVAVVWKLASADFVGGDTFEWLLVGDDRFHAVTRLLAGTSDGQLDAATEALRTAAGDAVGQRVPYQLGQRTGVVVGAMTAWTLVVETATAVAFLAPDRNRLARLRPAALMAFGWSTYLLVPVAGFSILFMTMGAVVAHPNRRVQLIYAASGVVFAIAANLRVLEIY